MGDSNGTTGGSAQPGPVSATGFSVGYGSPADVTGAFGATPASRAQEAAAEAQYGAEAIGAAALDLGFTEGYSLSQAVERAGQQAVAGITAEGQYGTYSGISPSGISAVGSVTEDELGALGVELGLATGAARQLGLEVDVTQQTVAPTTADISRFIGETVFGETYTASLSTFASLDDQQRAAFASQLEKGTIAADEESPTGIGRSAVGRLGEVAGFAFSGYSAAQEAAAATTAVQALGVTAATVPAIGAAALAGYQAYSSFQSLAQLAEEDVALQGAGLLGDIQAPETPTTTTGGGVIGIEEEISPTQTQLTTTPTTTATAAVPTVTPRPQGAALESTLYTGFFGADIPTIRSGR